MAFWLLAANGAACADDDGIPALLKFAEQRQAAPVALKEEAACKPAPAPAAKPAAIVEADGVRLTSLKQSLQRQAEKIRQLERQLAAAQVAPKRERAVVDIRPLVDALKGLRQAVAPVPEVGALAASLTRAEQRSARLAAQLAQQQRIDTLLAERQQATEPPLLTSEADKQAYAAGVSLGRDILHLQQENRRAGLEADRQLLLAGIADTLAGRLRLDEAAIDSALHTAQQRLQQAQQTQVSPLDGKAYLADFARQEGVKQDALGFYYRVDYAGSGAIGADDRVDIVVRESLTDGRVVKDMELAGTVISQPLTRYPPLFRAAIEKLQQHGAITLVVPPALAYGKQGNPPAIPPNATMIYTLRIADVQP